MEKFVGGAVMSKEEMALRVAMKAVEIKAILEGTLEKSMFHNKSCFEIAEIIGNTYNRILAETQSGTDPKITPIKVNTP
jgi:hypothetical protein